MTLKNIIFILFFLGIGTLNAQCAYEQIPNLYRDVGDVVKIIETKDRCALIALDVGKDTVTPDGTNMDILLIKNDSCGKRIWAHTYAFTSFSQDFISDILELPDGNLIMVTSSENDGIGGAYNFITWKLSATGKVIWKKFNGKGIDASMAFSIVYNPYRNTFLIAGSMERAYPSGGGLWNRPYILELDSNGDFLKERDIVINQDTSSYSALSLRIREFYMLEDSTFLGLVRGDKRDSIYIIRLDKNLNVQKITTPFLTKFNTYPNRIGGYYDHNKKCYVIFYDASLRDNSKIGSRPWLAEIDKTDTIIRLIEQPDSFSVYTIKHMVTRWQTSGYILGYDLLLVDSNLNPVKHSRFKEGIFIHANLQMSNGSIVSVGSKWYNDHTYARPYITQTTKNGELFNGNEPIPSIPIKDELKLYPNPATTTISIITKRLYKSAQVYTLTGNEVLRQNYHAEQTNIDVSTLDRGLYILTLIDEFGNMLHTQKLSIQR